MNISIPYKIIEHFDIDQVPLIWKNIDLSTFSAHKKIYPYQREALQNATKLLFKFYENNHLKATERLKKDFLKLAQNNGLTPKDEKEFSSANQESKAYEILAPYFKEDNDELPAYHFVNRMSFWMATGSGKSIVLIKLIELLNDLMTNDLIPKNDILFLTHRIDLIDQLKAHLVEFNQFLRIEKGIEFVVRDLKDFVEEKQRADIFATTQINIYINRSDLISDKKKENLLDFKTYENNGKWFVILDEAHKGDGEESKRKQYYNILSREGFLFNFSATFTDKIDILSTVYNLNLSEYIKKGFGKHLYVFAEEFTDFKTHKLVEGKKIIIDYIEEEKQKIVLMSLIMLTYVKMQAKHIRKDVKAYHNPLLLTLVNSVSAEDSDLYLFFSEIRKVAKNEVSASLFAAAKKAVTQALYDKQLVEFEKTPVLDDQEITAINNIEVQDVLALVFNTSASGELEVRRNPKNKQELSFRVKSGDTSEVFALIKVGDVSAFEKNNLAGYNIEEDFDNVSLFDNLEHSSVNILMGSRAFYEGWDSNRPNIINFVNIGTQAEAKKFILQSVGRGIRIAPIPNNRKRLQLLLNDGILVDETLKQKVQLVKPLETLFIFGTNQKAILSVLETLRGEENAEGQEQEHQLVLFDKILHNHLLLVPKYKFSQDKTKRTLKKLKINENDFLIFEDIMTTMPAELLALTYNLRYEDIIILNQHHQKENFIKIKEEKLGKANIIIKYILNYYKIVVEEVANFVVVSDEIKHHQGIKVKTSLQGSPTSIEFRRLEELKSKIEKAKNPLDIVAEKERLKILHKDDIDALMQAVMTLQANASNGKELFVHRNEQIEIKKLLNHYYYPSIVASSSSKDRISWINHIIDTPSEVVFLQAMEKHLLLGDNFFSKFDWWMFSKIDHTLDKEIRIPYIDPANGVRNFLPDFVFWLQRGADYHILYIDPKGTGRNDYQYKVDGYRALFEENGQIKVFELEGKRIRIHLRLVTEDLEVFGEQDFYKKYWIEKDNFHITLE